MSSSETSLSKLKILFLKDLLYLYKKWRFPFFELIRFNEVMDPLLNILSKQKDSISLFIKGISICNFMIDIGINK